MLILHCEEVICCGHFEIVVLGHITSTHTNRECRSNIPQISTRKLRKELFSALSNTLPTAEVFTPKLQAPSNPL